MSLEDVKYCCIRLSSDKVTERKKAADQLKSLLNNDHIVAALSRNSISKNGNSYNWDQVFFSSKQFLLKESEKLERDERSKESPTASIRSNWANTKRSAVSLPKLVLKRSCQGVPLVSVNLVSDFLFSILSRDRPYLLENFSGDAIQITHKYIFSYPNYYLHVPQEKWKDLLRIILWIYERGVKEVDVMSVLGVIEGVVTTFRQSKSSSLHFSSPSVALRPLTSFLCRTLQNSATTEQYGLQGCLLSLICATCVHLGAQWRYLLCRIGEETFINVVSLWENKATQRQANLLRYLNFQLIMHFPQQDGVFMERNEYCYDSQRWKRNLRQLYLQVIDSIEEISQLSRMTSAVALKASLQDEFVTFAARLCSQIFNDYDDVTSVDVTQVGCADVDVTSSSAAHRSKRRRIAVGFMAVCERLREEGSQNGHFPWYRIFCKMLTHHSGFFTWGGRSEIMLDLLLQILPQCKSPLITEEVLKCVEGLANPKFFPQNQNNFESCKRKWTKLAEIVTRLVAGKQCSEIGMRILDSLIRNQLSFSQSSLYRLFLRGVFTLNKEGLQLLEALLINYPLPKEVNTEDYLCTGKRQSDPRLALICLLLPLRDELEIENESCLTYAVDYPAQIANVLTLLTLHNPMKIKGTRIEKMKHASDPTEGERDSSELEEIYLRSLFSYKSTPSIECILDFKEGNLRTLNNIQTFVLERIKSFFAEHAVHTTEDGEQRDLSTVINSALLIVHLWSLMEDKRLAALMPKFEPWTYDIEVTLSPSTSESATKWTEISTALGKLNLLLNAAVQTSRSNNIGANLLQSLLDALPANFLDAIVQVVKSRELATANTTVLQNMSQLTFAASKNNGSSFDLDFDDEMDSSDNSANVVVNDIFEDDSETSQSSLVEKDSNILLSKSCLQPKDEAILNIVQLLANVYDLTSTADPSADDDEAPFVECVKVINKLARGEKLEDIFLALELVGFLFHVKYHDDNIEDGLNILSTISKMSSHNPRVVYCVLNKLKDLLICHGSKLIDDHQESVIHFLKTFSEKFSKGDYGLGVNDLIYDNIVQLSMIDPLRTWSTFHVGQNLDDRCAQLYGSLKSPYHVTRMRAVMNIPLLFQMEGKPLPVHLQKQRFENLYQIALESLNIEGTLHEDFSSDEGSSRVASFIGSLAAVASCSHVMEPQALYAIISAVKLNGIDTLVVNRALESISPLPHTTTSEYLTFHFDYLMTQWIRDKHPIADFPFQLFGSGSFDCFLRENCDRVVAALFTLDDGFAIVENVAEMLGIPIRSLILENFSTMLATLLPSLVAASLEEGEQMKISKNKITSATRKFKLLESALGPELLNSHTDNEIGEVALRLIRLAHDPKPWHDGEVVAPASRFHFESHTILFTVSHAHKVLFKDNTSLLSRLCDRKSPIHSVLHGLFCDIALAAPLEGPWLRLALAPLETFLRVVIQGIGSELGEMEHFLVKRLLHMLTNFIIQFAKEKHHVAVQCFDLLHDLFLACLNNTATTQIIISSLPSIIPRLHAVHSESRVVDSLYKVLLPLFESEVELMRICIANLPPLPIETNDSKLGRLFTIQQDLIKEFQGNVCLRKCIQKFVDIPCDEITSYDIQNILCMLTEKKCEICEIYCFALSERCTLAHALIHKLVTVVSNANDLKKGVLGLECLGKLGPVDLSTSVFAIQPVTGDQYSHWESKEKQMFAEIIIALNRLTFSGLLPVVEASVTALRRVLSLGYCYNVLKDLDEGDLQLDVLPFVPARKPKTSARQFQALSAAEFKDKIEDNSLWTVGKDFDHWLKRLIVALIESGSEFDFFNYLIPVCKIDVNFSKVLLPYVFHYVLKTDTLARREVVSKMVTYIVENLSAELSSGDHSTTDSHTAKNSLRTILNVVNYLRTKDPVICFSERKHVTKWERNLWLDVDFLALAKASYYCGSFFSAVLFAELACDVEQGKKTEGVSGSSETCAVSREDRHLPPLHRIASTSRGKEIASLLLQVYNALGASDGVEGCGGVSSVTNSVVQATLSLHRGHSTQALCISDAGNAQQCILNNLESMGMYNILYKMTNSGNKQNDSQTLEAQAECAWRLGEWPDLNQSDVGPGFHQSFLSALTALKNRDENSLQEIKSNFFQSTLAFFRENGNESTSSIYPILTQLQIFSEFTDMFKSIEMTSHEEVLSHLIGMESNWDEKENYGSVDKEYKEKILSARITDIKALSLIHKDKTFDLQNLLFRMLMKRCSLGNISERFRGILEAQRISQNPAQGWTLKLEEAKLSLSLGNNSQAICTLDNLLKDIKNYEATDGDEKLRGYYRALVLYGQVLMKSRTRSPKLVIKNYHEKAIELIEKKFGESCCEFLAESYHDLASFGDQLYQEVNLALSSDHAQSRMKQIAKSKQEIKRLQTLVLPFLEAKALTPEQKEWKTKYSLLVGDVRREKEDFARQQSEAQEYLNLTMENYLKVLTSSSKYDLSVFRVVALWLESSSSDATNALMFRYSTKIKSHKFIPLMYQLVARLSHDEEQIRFTQVLSSVLERVCSDHPHHGLPVLLMLANSHLDDEVIQAKTLSKGRTKSRRQSSVKDKDRVLAAKGLVERLKLSSNLTEHIAELQNISFAYAQLANLENKQAILGKNSSAASNSMLMKLRNLKYTTPLTRPLPIQPSASYSPPLITHWGPKVDLVGGINVPLKLSIYSSDGRMSHELLKGNDDLRQDAVLEQVFNVVNELLRKDQEASSQNLSVATYLVVPLSQKTGVIQWCDNTITLGEYLMRAHSRYYPKGLKINECRELMRVLAKQPDKLLKAFEEILENLPPVFRFFFYEEYPYPEQWFSQRRSYTRSVATSSIAGYILGLGDRHVQNLLLDKRTAEVIHIDLGIAFEKGKLLPTPEKVPFRLTQDIVDGFGAMGVEGPLRKSMETTMRVLREAKSVLTTIVEVLRHDPLHQWTLSPTQVAKLQQQEVEELDFGEGSDDGSASMAERALLRVQQKLNGLQDGLVLSVPEHVSVLIQQATDVVSLSQMFNGWQPYL